MEGNCSFIISLNNLPELSAKPLEVMAILALLLNDTISFIDFITL